MTITDSLIFCGFMLIIFAGVVGMASMMDRRTETMNTRISDVELLVILDGLRLLEKTTIHPTDKKIASDLAERLKNERRKYDKSGSTRPDKE